MSKKKEVNNLSSDLNMIEIMKIQERPVGNMLVGVLKLFIDVNGNTRLYQEY